MVPFASLEWNCHQHLCNFSKKKREMGGFKELLKLTEWFEIIFGG